MLRLILKDKGGKQYYLIPFVGPNLGVEIFLKKREHQKSMRWNRGLGHLGIFSVEVCLLFNCYLVIKGIPKALFSFIPWLLSFSDLPNCDSNSRERYKLRLMSKYLARSTLLPIGGKVPPTFWYPLWFP